MTRGVCALIAAAGLLGAGACATIPGQPPARQPGTTSGELVSRLAEATAGITSIRGLASVSYGGPSGSGSASQVIVIALPDRARLETLTPLGTAALVVAIHGDELRIHWLLRHEYGIGRPTPELLGRLIRVPLPPGPLLRLLAGLPPLTLDPRDPRLRVTTEAGAAEVESVDGAFWQRLWLGANQEVERGELGDGAGPLVRFRFADFQPVDGHPFPQTISLEGVTAKTGLTLHYQTVRLNQSLPAELFELPQPQDGNTKILRLDSGLPQGGGLP